MPEHVLDFEAIKAHAREELQRNWTGEYFAPHLEGAFPDNFLWDTCFVAIGLAEDEPELAASLLLQLKRYQWPNGMFANQNVDATRPGTIIERANFRTDKSRDAPENLPTSGFSQPPMLAEATLAVAEKLDKDERSVFLDEMVPSITKYHEWLFDTRDINGNGLVTQIHPYETGMDNSPPLELHVMDNRTQMERLLTSRLIMAVFGPAIDSVRRDFRHAPRHQRMHNASVAQYQLLTRKLARAEYDIDKILADPTIPLVEDVTFNSIFVRANQHLQTLAEQAGIPLPERLRSQIDAQRSALNHLWDPYHKTFYSRDARTKLPLKIKTIGSLMPLYATKLPVPHRDHLLDDLTDTSQFWTQHPVPSVPLKPSFHHDGRPLHDSERYWAGPWWLWMNSLIIDGLEQNGDHELAAMIRHRSLQTIANLHRSSGKMAYEYYHPGSGEGLGVYPFSAAAAMIIRLVNETAEAHKGLAKALY